MGALRFLVPFAMAAVVTFGLFYLMQSLIGVEGEIDDSDKIKVVDFVRVKRSEDVKKKEREPPKKEEIDDTPPPPDFVMDQNTSLDGGGIGIAAAVDTSMSLDTGGGFSMASADGLEERRKALVVERKLIIFLIDQPSLRNLIAR